MNYRINEESHDRFLFGLYSLLIFIVLVVGGVVLYLANNRSKYEKREVLTNYEVVNSASVSARLVVGAETGVIYKVAIYNATGVSGLAAKSAKSIEEKGVKLELKTGNENPVSGTRVSYKNEALKNSGLGSAVSLLWPSAKTEVDATINYDAVIIVGK